MADSRYLPTPLDAEIEALQARLRQLICERGIMRRRQAMQARHKENPAWRAKAVAAMHAATGQKPLPAMTRQQWLLYRKLREGVGWTAEKALQEAMR